MHAARHVPIISVERRFCIEPLLRAREGAAGRPSWTAICAKAYALVAAEMPELRRAYIGFPVPHFFEHRTTGAQIMIERHINAEPAVLFKLIKNPAERSLAEITSRIDHAASAPIAEVADFRRVISIARLPRPLRRLAWWIGLSSTFLRAHLFGTVAISSVANLGTDIVFARAPLTAMLLCGVVDSNGEVTVRLCFDHRCLDGATAARALSRIEEVMLGAIVEEIADYAPRRSGVPYVATAA